MKGTIVGAAMLIAAGVVANTPASGQRIAVDLAWHNSAGARVSGHFMSSNTRWRTGYLYCAPEGRYLYCWDRQSYRPGRPMLVHVFHGPAYRSIHYGYRQKPGRAHRAMSRRALRRHEQAALRAWQRWYREHRRVARPMYGAHRGSRRYATPRTSLRLRFHL